MLTFGYYDSSTYSSSLSIRVSIGDIAKYRVAQKK